LPVRLRRVSESILNKNQILKQVQDEVQGGVQDEVQDKDCEVYELIRLDNYLIGYIVFINVLH